MNGVIDGYRIIADDDLWEFINENKEFKEFVGQCVSHFVHFVIPRRDQTIEMEQDYPIPERIDISSSSLVSIKRNTHNELFVSFVTWI